MEAARGGAGTGRRCRLKTDCPSGRVGSSPTRRMSLGLQIGLFVASDLPTFYQTSARARVPPASGMLVQRVVDIALQRRMTNLVTEDDR